MGGFLCSFAAQRPVRVHEHRHRHDERHHLGRRHEIQHAVEPEPHRQQQHEPHAEHDLAQERQRRARPRLAERLQVDHRALVHARERGRAEKPPDAPHGEVRVVRALIFRAEEVGKHARAALKQHRRREAHDRLGQQQPVQQRPRPVAPPGADVVPHDGDAPGREPDGDGDDDLEKLHDDAHDRRRDLRILRLTEHGVERAVLPAHIEHRRHGKHDADLR